MQENPVRQFTLKNPFTLDNLKQLRARYLTFCRLNRPNQGQTHEYSQPCPWLHPQIGGF